jgi:hypothetical protein
MRRESHRCAALAVVALAVTACTSGDAESTTTVPATTATVIEATMTTAPPTTTTTEATTTTELTGTIGSPEALAALVVEANANSNLAYGTEVPAELIPDLTTGDPVQAARGLYELEAEIVQTGPVDEWVDVLVYPGSPISFKYLRDLQSLSGNQLVAVVGGDGYKIHEVRPAMDADREEVLAAIRTEVPDGSAIVVVTSSSGPIDYINPDGEVQTSNEGWSNRSRLVVVSPSESGWKLYWTEDV